MFPLKITPGAAFSPYLVSDPVLLRPPEIRDFEPWARLRAESRAHLTRWEDNWTEKDVTLAAFRRRLRAWDRNRRDANGLSLFVFKDDAAIMVGGVTLTNIRYGASRSAILGYWIGEAHAGCGYGARAVGETVRHAFQAIGLNRVEAACQPQNTASARLLSKLGFQREGRARGYLRINGVWRDHDIYARLSDDVVEKSAD